jgi:poly-gamma-glutamate capsule biosynthesis protein CapA/YwtB (metallophosphatase superfamily)
MKNLENTKHVNHQLNRRKFIISTLSAGFAAAVCPLYAQPATNSDKAGGLKGEQGNTESLSLDSGISAIKLFLCGDVMTGRGIDQVLPHPGNPALYEGYMKSAAGYVALAEEANGSIPRPVDFSYIWGDALAELKLRKPDLRIINLETAVTRSNDVQEKAVNYRMNPDNISCITAADIECCALANNHVLDWGYRGLAETLDTLRKAGIKTTGAGANIQEAQAPAILPVSGKGRVLVFSFGSETSGIPWSWAATMSKPGVNLLSDFSLKTLRDIRNHIGKLKRTGDVVVASIHWGGNWGYQVPREQQEFARWLIDDAGVDVVHGHSSHHAKGIEVYQGKLILYGCGDFLNDYEGISGHEAYRGDLSLMYFASLEPADGKLIKLDMVPMQMKRFRLNHASRRDALWLKEVLNREGEKFKSGVELVADTLMLRWTG